MRQEVNSGVRRTLLPILLVVAGLAAAPAVHAATGPCIPGTSGPNCYVWTGKIVSVDDGDTIKVRIGRQTTVSRVRLTGIQAMEQNVYSSDPAKRRGECHAIAATARFEGLVRRARGRVRLSARRTTSKTGTRLRRSVAVRINDRWRDVGRILVAEGRVLPFPNPVEYAGNRLYMTLAQQAQAKRIGMWNPEHCGVGPGPAGGLRVWVNWNASGSDGHNLNDEWVRIKNTTGTDQRIGGWWVRDSHLRRYTFPMGAVVRAGGTVTVHVGSGTNTSTRFYWNRDGTVFENATYDERAMGDGGYLFDHQGDVRAAMTYACRWSCTDRLAGGVEVRAEYNAPEHVRIRNVSGGRIDLEGYRLENLPYGYPFPPGTVLEAGETLTVYMIGSPSRDQRLVKYWGHEKYVLDNAGDIVTVKTFDDKGLDCYAWGSKANACGGVHLATASSSGTPSDSQALSAAGDQAPATPVAAVAATGTEAAPPSRTAPVVGTLLAVALLAGAFVWLRRRRTAARGGV